MGTATGVNDTGAGHPSRPPHPRLGPALRVLVAINVAAFVVELVLSRDVRALMGAVPVEVLVAMGGNHPPSVWAGEWWRLLASGFLHVNFWHMAINVYGLWIVGPMLEVPLGMVRTLLLYAGTAIVASATSVAFNGGDISVGASGALSGFIGALLGIAWLARDQMEARRLGRSLLFIIGLNLAAGVAINRMQSALQIDNHAHLGGVIAGLLLGTGMLAARRDGPWRATSLIGHIGFALLATFSVGIALEPRDSPQLHASRAERALDEQQPAEARRIVEGALHNHPLDVGLLGVRARACLAQNEAGCVEEALARILSLEPLPTGGGSPLIDGRELYVALARLSMAAYEDKEWTVAIPVARRAAGLFPDDDNALNNCAWFLVERGGLDREQAEEALELADRARRIAGGDNDAVNHTHAMALHAAGRSAEALDALLAIQRRQQAGWGVGRMLSGGGIDPSTLESDIATVREAARRSAAAEKVGSP